MIDVDPPVRRRGSTPDHRFLSVVLLLIHPILIGGACRGVCPAEYGFSFHQSGMLYQLGSAEWNTVVDRGNSGPDVLSVLFFNGDFVDSGAEPIELYSDDGRQIAMPREYFDRPGLDCGPTGQLSYYLTDVPNGTYTVVHRLSSITGLTLSERGPVLVDGELALVTTLVLDR